jgi:hypothetical protein
VRRAEAEKRRGFDHAKTKPAEQAAQASPFFEDLLDAQIRMFNPRYTEGPGALAGDLRRFTRTSLATVTCLPTFATRRPSTTRTRIVNAISS